MSALAAMASFAVERTDTSRSFLSHGFSDIVSGLKGAHAAHGLDIFPRQRGASGDPLGTLTATKTIEFIDSCEMVVVTVVTLCI